MDCKHDKKRKRVPAFKEQILEALMEVQSECNVSTKCLNLILKKLHPFLKGCEHIEPFKMPRVRARARSPIKQQMHGCVGCNKHVFGPQDHDLVCPTCGTARYARDGKPKEVPVCVCMCVMFDFRACVLCSGMLVLSVGRADKKVTVYSTVQKFVKLRTPTSCH